MKKILVIIFCALIIGCPSAGVFGAGPGLSFSEKSQALVAGREYFIDLFVDAGQSKDYAVKMALDFPANLLEVKDFWFDDGWIEVTVAPYSAVDEKNGTMIKTAGFPGGFSGKVKLGTINFYAKRAGYGKLTFLPESLAYDISGKNTLADYSAALTFSGSGAGVSVKPQPVAKPAVKPAPVVTKPVAVAPSPEPVKPVKPKELIPPARPYIREKLAVEPLPTPAAVVEISDYEKYLREAELNGLIMDNAKKTQALKDRINQSKNIFATPLYALIGSLIIIFVAVVIAGIGGRRRPA